MLSKIKHVNNPLTIISIFAGLAEIAGTTALSLVDKELQYIFIWFVMLFPVFLVTVFFLTLNLNAKALYAPSDYKNEENFIRALNRTRVASNELSDVTAQIESIKQNFLNQISDEHNSLSTTNQAFIRDAIKKELVNIDLKVKSTQEKINHIIEDMPISSYPFKKACPKCDGIMHLDHDLEEYKCDNCEHWEWAR